MHSVKKFIGSFALTLLVAEKHRSATTSLVYWVRVHVNFLWEKFCLQGG